MTMTVSDLPSPCLLLDRQKLNANARRMSKRVTTLGVTLRPHVKTPKSVHVLKEILGDQRCGVTVSTLREASYFLDHGFTDIFYAVTLDPKKVPAVAELLRRGADLKVLIDSMQGADLLISAARVEDVIVPAVVEIDVDHFRCGIDADDPDFIPLCRLLAESKVTDFRGLMSYGGASYGCSSDKEMTELTERHRHAMVSVRAGLSAAGIHGSIFSFGSTPATLFASSLDGFTEARCGIYMFQDLYQAGINACSISDIALSVLTTVIGRQPRLNRFTVDAGGLALSKDRSTQGKPFDAGFGLVCDAQTGLLIDDLYVATTSQELGLVTSRSGKTIDFDSFPVGRRLRILPNHADMTAAAYELYHVLDEGGRVVDQWGRANGWDLPQTTRAKKQAQFA